MPTGCRVGSFDTKRRAALVATEFELHCDPVVIVSSDPDAFGREMVPEGFYSYLRDMKQGDALATIEEWREQQG